MSHLIRVLVGVLAVVCLPRALAADEREIDRAIEKGVAALKKSPALSGEHRYEVGATALVGLALLECGVPADDPAVQEATRVLRRAAGRLTHTYSLALAIAYFDKLGDPADRPLIRAMGLRLRTGQNDSGGWTYHCPLIEPGVTSEKGESLEVGAAAPPQSANVPPPFRGKFKFPGKGRDDDPPQPQAPPPRSPDVKKLYAVGDNSNTQFAALGLWIARRHGVATDEVLEKLGNRFRDSQNADGGWGYVPRSSGLAGMNTTPAMTCAGLLALAVAHGDALEAPRARPRKLPQTVEGDAAIRNGLNALGRALNLPLVVDRNEAPLALRERALHRGYYFLWSMERVAVILELQNIGTKDWYQWGAPYLLSCQNANGTWEGEHGRDVDTAFALLFLRRSNLAPDLTALLRLSRTALRARVEKPLEAAPAPANATEAADALRLRRELLRAPADQRETWLERLRDAKGVAYTLALALAIRELDDTGRKQARQALADRLTRMTAATLRQMLEDDDAELRRAAALACGMKDDRSHIPDLIPLVLDPETLVVRAAHASLKSLSGQDFGPAANASAADRQRAAERWWQWWEGQR
jgi:hypothetical protein